MSSEMVVLSSEVTGGKEIDKIEEIGEEKGVYLRRALAATLRFLRQQKGFSGDHFRGKLWRFFLALAATYRR